MRRAGHVAGVEKMRYPYKILLGYLKGRDLDINVKTMLKWILKKYVSVWTGFNWLRIESGILK
jgi:hypothetical protein